MKSNHRKRSVFEYIRALPLNQAFLFKLIKHFFFLFYSNFLTQYLYAAISEVTALVPVHWESMYALAIYTAERIRQRWPILLSTESQQDMEIWVIQPQCQILTQR